VYHTSKVNRLIDQSMKYERNFYQIKSNEEILINLKKEIKSVGYYSLYKQNITSILSYAKKVKKKYIYLVGIGGSSLGTKAIYTFLRTTHNFKKKLFFLDTIDPLRINYLLSLGELDNSQFIVISKSGTTIEPISILKYLDSKITISKDNCSVIAGEKTPLWKFASEHNLEKFSIPDNVGGRFSVFSPVGLVPLAIIGADIQKLLDGCKVVHESFFGQEEYYDLIINKARFLVENKSRFAMNIIFSYSSVFRDFNRWFVQLWAESLGKKNINATRQGLTPISLIGPDDQHSFLQLVMDGPRDKTVTFFKIDNLNDESAIPGQEKFNCFDLNSINEKSFNKLINLQADSTYEAILQEKDIPCDKITITSINEINIAKLMYRFLLLTSSVGSFMQINTYDQPGVELGKKILKRMLKDDH